MRYLDGPRFWRGFGAGCKALLEAQEYLNRINVFPVADGDTGINMAMTMQAVLNQGHATASLKATLCAVADAALTGARGNSGIILAQYMHGLYRELPDAGRVSADDFARAARRAVDILYESILNPVEGTILTVIRAWADFLLQRSNSGAGLLELLGESLQTARASLAETPSRLPVLAEAGVVDAGASGFVSFLEGVVDYIGNGSLRDGAPEYHLEIQEKAEHQHPGAPEHHRYCCEAIIRDCSITIPELKRRFSGMGDSLILAGGEDKLHFHIHASEPWKLFEQLHLIGTVQYSKVDDMLRQYQVIHARKHPVGLVTDSACDLPRELMDQYQILQVPFGISFGDKHYLDKLTISPQQFYSRLQTDKYHPVSSQPSPQTVRDILHTASGAYEHVIAVHLSEKLSGVCHTSASIAARDYTEKISVVNSRQLSVTEGLVTLRVARAIESGMPYAKILEEVNSWIDATTIYTDINTLRYMVRGGRVKPLAGIVAAILNLKPIVSLDAEGKALVYGKSFSRKSNMRRIISIIRERSQGRKIWEYAIVHADAEARALQYARELSALLGKKPAYVMQLSPVVGVHNGIGAVGIGIAYDRP